jgi:hypothetical protein
MGWLNDLREDSLRLTDEEAVAIAERADTSIRDRADVVALNHRRIFRRIGVVPFQSCPF